LRPQRSILPPRGSQLMWVACASDTKAQNVQSLWPRSQRRAFFNRNADRTSVDDAGIDCWVREPTGLFGRCAGGGAGSYGTWSRDVATVSSAGPSFISSDPHQRSIDVASRSIPGRARFTLMCKSIFAGQSQQPGRSGCCRVGRPACGRQKAYRPGLKPAGDFPESTTTVSFGGCLFTVDSRDRRYPQPYRHCCWVLAAGPPLLCGGGASKPMVRANDPPGSGMV
jgi:hypothetical protein